MKKLNPIALAAALALVGSAGAALAQAQARSPYIVQLAGEPAATYKGNVAGYAATAPTAGTRFSARTPAALVSATPERGEHTDEILREIGVSDADIALLRGGKVIL